MPDITKSRNRQRYIIATVCTIVIGLASRKFPGMLPAILGKYPGDALWATMVFFGLAVLMPKTSAIRLAVYALTFAYLIEFSQLYQAPWINSIRATTPGHLVLGNGFIWIDFVAYTIGVILGVLADKCMLPRSPKDS
jgi:hypothetical protein